jgi:hypothetical protein
MGAAAALCGALIVALLVDRGPVTAGVGSFIMGVGLGFLGTSFVVAIQTSVEWGQRGVATATNLLMRILGNALGAALFGGILNYRMSHYLQRSGLGGSVSIDSIQALMGDATERGGRLSAAVLASLRTGLAESLHLVFWGIALMGVVSLLIAWRVPEMERGEPS